MSVDVVTVRPERGASSTQLDFIRDLAHREKCLMGPRGEGKTEAGIRALTYLAAKCPAETRPIPGILVRDTWKNIERTTLQSFLSPHRGSFAEMIRPFLQISENRTRLTLPGLWRLDLVGMDSLGDLDKLQSYQAAVIWLEEVSPAAVEEIGGGLREEVVTVGITSLRHPVPWRFIMITSNYPDEDHWAWRRYYMADSPRRKLYRIPSGENLHLPVGYRDDMRDALADDEGLRLRLVEGEPGFVVQGRRVTPEFHLGRHKADIVLQPFEKVHGYRLWDGGLNPTCIVCQVTPMARFQVFDSWVGDGIGMLQLVEEEVGPAMRGRFSMVKDWTDIGDPSLKTPDQHDSTWSAARVIQDRLGSVYIPGAVDWETRRLAVKASLIKTVDGLPWLQISKNERYLTKALRGGWHYPVSASGMVGDKPRKDMHSHPGDAYSYGQTRLLKFSEIHRVLPTRRDRYSRVKYQEEMRPLAM